MKNSTDQSNQAAQRLTKDVPMQCTVAKPVTVTGKGVLTGDDVDLVITPAAAGEGILFERTDIEPAAQIPALVANADDRARRTTLSAGDVTIETVEHLMSA